MPDATEVTRFITGSFGYQRVNERQIEVVMGLADDRTQSVYFYTTDDFAVFESPFAVTSEFNPGEVLAIAQSYPFGVNLSGEVYIVRHSVPLASASRDEVIEVVQWVAMAGDDLEKELGGQDRF